MSLQENADNIVLKITTAHEAFEAAGMPQLPPQNKDELTSRYSNTLPEKPMPWPSSVRSCDENIWTIPMGRLPDSSEEEGQFWRGIGSTAREGRSYRIKIWSWIVVSE